MPGLHWPQSDDDEGSYKSPLASKTIHFNFIGLIGAGIWPFLPKHFREHEYALSAITAWITLTNIMLRFVTKEAITFRKNDK